jgi:hypothetical protein
MLANYLSRDVLAYSDFRMLLALLMLLLLVRLWRRPHPAWALAMILGAHLLTSAATLVPLARPYAMSEASDRSFNLGMAARVALFGSPFEHTQVGFASPEPLSNALVAALALFDVQRVPFAMALLTPIALAALAFGLYFGLMADASESDAWERVLLVFAVLGLSSLTMSPRPPTPAFWAGNFLLKPMHGAALGLVAVIAGLVARRARPQIVGLALGALAWLFLVDWAYLMVGLLAAALLKPRPERRLREFFVAALVSGTLALPYVLHLLPDYSPGGSHGAARHMWGDPLGLPLAVPNWSTLDLGPLLALGVGGALLLWRRRSPRDVSLLGVFLGASFLVLVSIPASLVGVAPEPDELHYYLRFGFALMAGAALAGIARHVETSRGLRAGQGHVLVLAACLPLSIPCYWDPPSMDRYFAINRQPIKPKVLAYARFVRESTPKDAVFAAGRVAASWIPALTGRRVLLAEGGKLMPPDQAERKAVERTLLLSQDPAAILTAAARYGVTHIAIDEPLKQEYGVSRFDDLCRPPLLKTVFANSAARIVAIQRQ